MRGRFFKIVLLSFLVYMLSWVVVYSLGINTLSIQSEDTIPAMITPLTLLKEKTIYLDTYVDMMIKKYPHPDDKDYVLHLTPFYLRKIDNHYVSAFPIIISFLILPLYLLPTALNIPITWELLAILSHVSASLTVSLSGGFLYLLIKKHLCTTYGNTCDSKSDKKYSDRIPILLTIVYLFATVNYAMLSQGIWQHGFLQLFVILGLYFLFNYLKQKTFKDIFLCGLFFGISLLIRPTSLLVLFFVFLILFLNFKFNLKPYLSFLLGIIPSVLFFLWYNAKYYVSITNQGYADQLFKGWLSPFPEGFLGVWLSPSKGILVYSPIFIFSLIGLYLALKNLKREIKELKKNKEKREMEILIKSKEVYYVLFGIIVLVHTLIISFWKHWYGGWSFGYRMSSDIILFLVLLLIPYLESQNYSQAKKFVYINTASMKIFFVALVISTLVQLSGIIFFDGIWHAAYDLGYENTSWLWSIKDSEVLFNIRRVLVKANLLDKACPKCLP